MINNRAYRGVGMEAALGKVENHKNRMTPPPPTSFFTDPDKKKLIITIKIHFFTFWP